MTQQPDKKPKLMLTAGAYGFAIARRAIQHHYMGGGHPGCGGCVWALEFVDEPREAQFVLYEFRSDQLNGQRHRTVNCESLDDLFACWECMAGRKPLEKGNLQQRFSTFTSDPPWFYYHQPAATEQTT